MKLKFGRCALVSAIAAVISLVCLYGQGRAGGGTPLDLPPQTSRSQEDGARLPNGKLQRDEILKAEHEQNLKDAAQLATLAEQLKEDIEKNESYVLSVSTLKKTDDIEKLARKIRSRMRHN